MNCLDYEKWILLTDSHETSETEQSELNRHLADCSSCQAFQQLLLQAHSATELFEPSDVCMHRVELMVANQMPLQQKRTIHMLRPTIGAAAASILIGLGLFFQHRKATEIGMELSLRDGQLLEMDEQLVDCMYYTLTEDDLAFDFLMSSDG